jgi:fructan beta-fructosidase
MDYGADNYAGVTFSNVPEKDGRRILIGWMSNWQYANAVPTEKWRSATTIPRELSIEKTPAHGYRLNSTPIKETIDCFAKGKTQTENSFESENGNYLLELSGIVDAAGTLEFSNEKGERFNVKFDKSQLITDRTMAGESSFSKEFAAIHKAPLNGIKVNKIQVFVDASSVEIFINDGELVMTELIFPNEPLTKIKFMGNTQEKKIYYLK